MVVALLRLRYVCLLTELGKCAASPCGLPHDFNQSILLASLEDQNLYSVSFGKKIEFRLRSNCPKKARVEAWWAS